MYKTNPASPVAHIEPPQQMAHMRLNPNDYPEASDLDSLLIQLDTMWAGNASARGRTDMYAGAHPAIANYKRYKKDGKTCYDVPVGQIVISTLLDTGSFRRRNRISN